MKEIICINDKFPPVDEAYMKMHGIVKPKEGTIYTIREVVKYPIGEPGLLLNEIINPATPKISPTTGVTGKAEQTWAISRFSDLLGNRLISAGLNATITEKSIV